MGDVLWCILRLGDMHLDLMHDTNLDLTSSTLTFLNHDFMTSTLTRNVCHRSWLHDKYPDFMYDVDLDLVTLTLSSCYLCWPCDFASSSWYVPRPQGHRREKRRTRAFPCQVQCNIILLSLRWNSLAEIRAHPARHHNPHWSRFQVKESMSGSPSEPLTDSLTR